MRRRHTFLPCDLVSAERRLHEADRQQLYPLSSGVAVVVQAPQALDCVDDGIVWIPLLLFPAINGNSHSTLQIDRHALPCILCLVG